jgi:hypothetical protein
MNIVVATPHLVYPTVAHGGGQDLMALIRFLGERHAVRVAAFVDEASERHAEALAPHVAELRLVRPAVSWGAKWRRAVAAVRAGEWRTLGQRAEREMRSAIAGWARAGQAEVVLCAWTEMGRYLLDLPANTVRVLDEVDVRFIVELAEAGARPLARWRALRRQLTELGYCRAAHLVLTRSQRDLDALRTAVPGLRGQVLPPVAHTAELLGQPATPLGEAGRVLFVGALDRRRNQQAAEWLAHGIWPAVRAAHPQARLRLVGAHPPPKLQRLAALPSVEVTGWVADLPAEYRLARVVVAPLRSEAGALNKVMDALAAGRPVVATTVANAGVGAPPGAIRLADDAPAFARAISQLLTDDHESRCLGAAARRFAEATFDWPRAAGEVEAALIERAAAIRGGR